VCQKWYNKMFNAEEYISHSLTYCKFAPANSVSITTATILEYCLHLRWMSVSIPCPMAVLLWTGKGVIKNQNQCTTTRPTDIRHLHIVNFAILYQLIFYVTRFSIGWKNGVILYHPPKKTICDVYAQTSLNTQIEYSAETNHGTCKVLLHNIYVFDMIKW
jgi:hypothetical protein